MNIENLMNKKISREDFIKSLGFILLVLLLFPKNAVSIFDKENETDLEKKLINGKKAIEIIDE